MAAARGRAHLEFGLAAAGRPAIAAAVWCAPVELSELWHLLADVMEPERGKARARLVAERRAALDRLARDAAATAAPGRSKPHEGSRIAERPNANTAAPAAVEPACGRRWRSNAQLSSFEGLLTASA